MSTSEEQVRDALRSVRYPGFSRDIVSFGLVKGVDIDNGDVKVQLALATNDPNIPATIKSDAEKILRELDGFAAKSFDRYPRAAAGAGASVGATRIPELSTSSQLRAGKAALENRPSRQISPSRLNKPRRASVCATVTFMVRAFH